MTTPQFNRKKTFSERLETPAFRRFMSVAYGLGASVVILGALFKINHYRGANEMLLVGMITEAIIFALSALQRPHVEPDWSKIYPEFLEDYYGIKPDQIPDRSAQRTSGSNQLTQLDLMLQNVKLDESVIQRLGTGLTKLSESASRLSDLTDASLATQDFVMNMRSASQSVSHLSRSYNEASQAISSEIQATNDLTNNIKELSNTSIGLKNSYHDASRAIREDVRASEELSHTLKTTSDSLSRLAENYQQSAEKISKTIEELKSSTFTTEKYNEELSKLSEQLASLNKLYELQLQNSEMQARASEKMYQALQKFLENLEESSSRTLQYQREIETLTKRMALLNNIYGNMLSAMNVK